MNQWSRRRKRIIFLIVFFSLIVIVGIPTYFLFYRAPTCFDGKLNGDETGIDCGGSCQLLCTADSLPLITKGDPKVLEVNDGLYEVAALIENPNVNAEVYRAQYTFTLYDATSTIPVKTIDGEAYVPRGKTFGIFEGPFALEPGVVPVRATLVWNEISLVWQHSDKQDAELRIADIAFSREDSNPRLDATVENLSLEDVSNIDVVVLLSDETGSIFAASKTYIDHLSTGGKATIVFTWPRPFEERVLDIKIIPRILPDSSFIR